MTSHCRAALQAAGLPPTPPIPSETWACLRVRPNPKSHAPIRRGGGTRLNRTDVLAIRECRRMGLTYREIAIEFDISEAHVRGICTGERRTNITDEEAA